MAKDKHPIGKLIDDPKLIIGTATIDPDDAMAEKKPKFSGDLDKLSAEDIICQSGLIIDESGNLISTSNQPWSLLAEVMCPLEFAMIPEAPFHLKAFGVGLDASHLK